MSTSSYDWLTNTELNTVALQAQRHNDQRARGHSPYGSTAHSRHCSLCAVLGSGRHNPTLMRRHQRVAGEAWRVRATSGVGASEPALPRSLRCDLVLCCCVMSYSVLILSNTVAIPQRCRRSLHRHHHPRRTVAATAAAAAAATVQRRLLCCGCGWGLLRLFLKKLKKNWLFCCGDGRGDRARPSCCAETHLTGHRLLRPRRCFCYCGCGCGAATSLLLLLLRLRCCYCGAAAAVLFSLSRTRVPKVLCVHCCGRSMLLCVDSIRITGWHVFYLLCAFSLWNFYRKLTQMHAGVNI